MAKASSRKAGSKPRKKSAPPPRARKAAASSTQHSRRATAPRTTKWVYAFGAGKAEGRADMRNLLGGKGAGLAEMANLGLSVPPGFTITTEVCTAYYRADVSIRRGCGRKSRPRWPRSAAGPGVSSATGRTRCSSRCVQARAPRCPA